MNVSQRERLIDKLSELIADRGLGNSRDPDDGFHTSQSRVPTLDDRYLARDIVELVEETS